jgi:acylphosphatase
MLRTVSIRITGKVQGVFFRRGAEEKAEELGLTGEVQNMADDSVHIVATGEPEKLEQLIEWCRLGPPRARVENVAVGHLPLEMFEKFRVVR